MPIRSGSPALFYPHQNLGDRFVLFTPAYYEHEERELLPQVLRADSTFVDIGANTGFYSLFAARSITGPEGRILAFEPNPVMFDRFMLNIAFNGLESRIEAMPVGLAEREGDFDLHFNPGQLGGASMVPGEAQIHLTVPCRPLLDVLREKAVTEISVLKIDVEGYEANILKPFFAAAPSSLFRSSSSSSRPRQSTGRLWGTGSGSAPTRTPRSSSAPRSHREAEGRSKPW